MPNSSNQKFFDIVPPKKIEEKIPPKREIKGARERKLFRPRPGKLFPKIFFLIIILLLILGGAFAYLIFQKAEIIIWPKTQEVSFKEKINVNLKANQVDFTSNTIPGGIFEDNQKISQEFTSSGKTQKEVRAEGIIRAYNAYSTSPQTLVATTRFVSADGKLFRSLEEVTIPGGQYEKGKLVPGFIDVRVRADKPGEEYNIGPSTFSIPGFAGTPRYTAFYGKSFESIKGGFRGEASQVTQEDLNRAENILKEKLLEVSKISLKNKTFEEIVALEDAFKKEFSNIIFSAKPGEEKTSFVGEGQLFLKALVFKKSDLENFVGEYILSQAPKDQKLDLKSLEINYSVGAINIDEGQMVLNSDFSAKIYFEILKEEIKKDIKGKLLPEAKEFLSRDPRIAKLEIKLRPFWVERVPQDIGKIRIKQMIDSTLISP